MVKDIKKIARSIRFSVMGLRHAWKLDKSFRMEILYGIPVYVVIAFFLWPLAPMELIVYVFSFLLILIVELVNTAFEKMLDRIHPEQHELIGKSKDIASAAVLVTFLFAGLVVFLIVWVHLTSSVWLMGDLYA